MPSQAQVKWAQLRVGITVVVAASVLAVLIFLMTGTSGFLTRKVVIHAFFDNASGVRVGAPVTLQGVTVGNVSEIRIVPNHGLTPVQVFMKIPERLAKDIPTDALVSMTQAGVLGETYIDIDRTRSQSTQAVKEGSELQTRERPDIQDVIRSTQTSLQNVDVLIRRLDRIVSFVESGQGSIGKLIYDQNLYNRLNSTLNEVQTMMNQISSGQGSIGKLIASDELYNKANTTVDRLDAIVAQIQHGKGTIGKLVNDPSLYDNANQTIAKANTLMTDINAGKGALGKMAKDEQFAAKLDNSLTKLSAILNELQAGEGTAGRLLKDPSLYTNTNQMLVETRTLVQSIRENPKKYLTIRFKLF